MDAYAIYDKYGREVNYPVKESNNCCHDFFEKQRKLTSDSGYGDEMTERRDSIFSDCDYITIYRDSIAEDPCKFTQNKCMDDITEDCENFKLNDGETLSVVDDYITIYRDSIAEDTCKFTQNKCMDDITEDCQKCKLNDGETFSVVDDKQVKNQRKRRVTPIPKEVRNSKPSKVSDKRNFFSVEEEDADDVDKYNSEDDFICPNILSCQRYMEKRNSWHGRTEEELRHGFKKRIVSLQKSKSLDRDTTSAARRRRRFIMSRSSLTTPSFETTSTLTPINSNFDTNVGIKTPCYTYKTMNKNWQKENDNMCEIQVSIEPDLPQNKSTPGALPLWMKEAEAELNSSEGSSHSEDDSRDDALSKKLQIPDINWEKLNEEKNKNNQILSNQRRQKRKERNKVLQNENRRRKLTPSESPSLSSLDTLSNLKSSVNQWTLVEEEEEEAD